MTCKRLNNSLRISCYGAARGMAYLEEMGIVHRDLSARNLLVDAGRNVKVSDFGLSFAADEKSKGKVDLSKFPVKWSAPEVLKDAIFSTKSDVWSMGVTMYEIITKGRGSYYFKSAKGKFHTLECRMPKWLRKCKKDIECQSLPIPQGNFGS